MGPYEIGAPIGAGGMGEVCRVRDTKLKREVALKVLPDAFAQDTERMARLAVARFGGIDQRGNVAFKSVFLTPQKHDRISRSA